MEKHTMGSLMLALRKSKGMTQQDIADKLGISNKTISKWECDDGYPDISMLPAIAEIYGITIDELLKGEINNEEKQEKATSTDKSKKQIELLLSTSFEKFKNVSVIALVLALLSVVLGFLLKNIIDDFLFEATASLIALCASITLSVSAIVLVRFAVSRLSFSLSGDNITKYIDKVTTYLKKARNSITVVVAFATVGIFISGAMYFSAYYDEPAETTITVSILIAIAISIILFFIIGSKLTIRVDNEIVKSEASYSKKTALGLIAGSLCVALIASCIVGGVFKITNNHTYKFINEDVYSNYKACYIEDKYPLIEKDEENLTVTVVNMLDISLTCQVGLDISDTDDIIDFKHGEANIVLADGEHYYLVTDIYTFDSKENMDKFVDENCIDSDFLSLCSRELLDNTARVYEHNDDELTVKYFSRVFNDVAGICALTVVGSCIIFDGVYIAVRYFKKKNF